MRYMFLIYSRETDMAEMSVAGREHLRAAHWALMDETRAKGIFQGAEPLHPTVTATSVRMEGGQPLVLDGPFAETKEQLAGYYILDCKDLDEAIGWAAKIPTACKGGAGCIEIRPMMGLPAR
jgi:hypothetical protein